MAGGGERELGMGGLGSVRSHVAGSGSGLNRAQEGQLRVRAAWGVRRPRVACGAASARGGREARPTGTCRPVSSGAAGGVTPPSDCICPVPPGESC